MEDYELTIATIEYYKNKACELVDGNCDLCQAIHEYDDKKWCCFDTVIRFIEYVNGYSV